MKNDIIPPKLPRPAGPEQKRLSANTEQPDTPITSLPPVQHSYESEEEIKKPAAARSPLRLVLAASIGLVVLLIASFIAWYVVALRPVSTFDVSRERIVIAPGSSLSGIGDLLEEKDLIRSSTAFTIYARLTGAGASLQAGTFSLSASESAIAILGHFTSGSDDKISLTFLPGATLRRLPGESSSRRTDVKSVLLNAGYSEEEIEAAFSKEYSHPLFVGKPASADLEGYIYGETYTFGGGASVEQILEQTFDEYYSVIEGYNLIEGFRAQGLTLFEGITLASIIQREVTSQEDQKQVAQVFLTRLESGMPLGADPTYQYAAKKANVPPNPSLNSPYNTRKVVGLPPGPIAMPGQGALQAVAAPAAGDYLYFVSGDDDVTYFARTNEEHEANVRNHCREKCSRF